MELVYRTTLSSKLYAPKFRGSYIFLWQNFYVCENLD